MNRYKNVTTLLDTAESYDLERITGILLTAYDLDDVESLAEDIGFVVVSLWALIPADKQMKFKERLTDEIVNVEIKEMFGE